MVPTVFSLRILPLLLCCPICCADLSAGGSRRSTDGLSPDKDKEANGRDQDGSPSRAAAVQGATGRAKWSSATS